MSRRLLDGALTRGAGSGVPSLLESNPDLMNQIINSIRMGNWPGVACRMFGVTPSTYHTWIAKGIERPESIYGAFKEGVYKAIAEAEARDLAVIDSHAHGRPRQYERDKKGEVKLDKKGRQILLKEEIKSDPHWAAWKIERRAPHRWGKQERSIVSPEAADEIDVTPKSDNSDTKQSALKEVMQIAGRIEELDEYGES